MVKESEYEKNFYLHEVFIKEVTPTYSRTGLTTNSKDTASAGVICKLAQKYENIKREGDSTLPLHE